MSILLDTGVWFGKVHVRDEHHEEAQSLIAACMDDVHGAVYTTTDVVDEVFTLALSRGGAKAAGMIQDLAGFLGFTDHQPTIATVIGIDVADQRAAWPLFERHYEDRQLSYTDCTSLLTIRERGIDRIASFDDGFDGLVETVPDG